jgi:perosamine synthetase
MTMSTLGVETLAIQGGPTTLSSTPPRELFHWPIVMTEDQQAVLKVLRSGRMSGNEITKKFEAEFAAWMGMKHALVFCNGTSALLASFWACGLAAGDEIIGPSMTYWASITGALQLGATVNFADIDPVTLCIDPNDIEHRIGSPTLTL